MYFKTVTTLLMALVLAACTSSSDATAEKQRHLKSKDNAVDVVFTSKNVAEQVVGFRATRVTTVISKKTNAMNSNGGPQVQSSQRASVTADCKIKSDGYSAEFQTPATVNMPSMGKTTKPLELTCTYEGQTYSDTYSAVNLSSTTRTNNAVSVGIILCPICGVAMAAGNAGEKSGDAFGFTDIEIKVE